MRRFVLLAAVTIFVSSCATTNAVVATVKDCANQVTHSAALGVMGDVSSAVVCDQASGESLPACVKAQLLIIAKKAGWAAVDCAIAQVQADAADHVNNLPISAAPEEAELFRWRRAGAARTWRSGPDGGSGTAPPGAP